VEIRSVSKDHLLAKSRDASASVVWTVGLQICNYITLSQKLYKLAPKLL